MMFKDSELACKHCGLLKLNRGFRDALEQLRQEFGRPMTVRSACRCKVHNAEVGGKEKSFHIGDEPAWDGLTGCAAVDIATPDGAYRGQLFQLAWARGWSIGWNAAKQFLHLDRRVDVGLPQTSFDY